MVRSCGRRRKSGRLILVALLGLVTSAFAQWTLSLSCETYPSPSISDWERLPGIVRIGIAYSGTTPARVYLESAVLSAETREEIASGESDSIAFTGPRTVQLDNRSFLKYRNITYNPRLREAIMRTNRLPEGVYDLKVQLKDAGEHVLDEKSVRFYILSFRRPALNTPDNGASVMLSFPTFQWTPATTHQGFPVTYRLKLSEILPGQTPQQAISNPAVHEANIVDRTSYVYPNSAQALVPGKDYVWQVQAVDSRGRALGDYQGRSEVSRFKRMVYAHQYYGHFAIITQVTAHTTVQRSGSYYNVRIDVGYPSNATNLGIRVWNRGFQCCTNSSNIGEVYCESDSGIRSVYKVQFSAAPPNGTYEVSYQAVPIMAHPWPWFRICDSLNVTFKIGTTQYSLTPDMSDARKTISDVYSGAFRAAHYLVLTAPDNLFAWYDHTQVNSLLNWVGKLAVARSGVVAYVAPGTNQWDLREALRGDRIGFGGLLALNWGEPVGSDPGSYVLIVGEDNIIGTWDISGFTVNWSNGGPTTIVERSDFPWADCDGDNLPEFALGRIVGRTAQELERPIRAALLPQSRATVFPIYMFSGRDGGSAACQQSFENAIDGGSGLLSGYGCSVATTKFSTLANDAARVSAVQSHTSGRSVVLFTGHGNVNNWDCFSGGNVPGLGFDNVHLPLFLGFTCLSGSYAAGNSIARACLAKQGTRGFLGAVQVSAVSINSAMTASDFWPGFRNTGRQSAGVGLYWIQYGRGLIWSFLDGYNKLWVWEYNFYGDPW